MSSTVAMSNAVTMKSAAVTISSFDVANALPAPRPRLRLTRRGRAALTTLAALPIVIGALVFTFNGGGAIAAGERVGTTFQHVTVQSGESLWSVAESIAPNADPRDVIAELVKLNGLESAVVSPGQQLAVPTQYAG